MLKQGFIHTLFLFISFFTGYFVSGFLSRVDLAVEVEKTKMLERELEKCSSYVDSLTIVKEFKEVSDSVWTQSEKIKYRQAKDAESRTDSLVFIADEKIKLMKWKKYNDSIEEVRLRTEIDQLKSSHK